MEDKDSDSLNSLKHSDVGQKAVLYKEPWQANDILTL